MENFAFRRHSFSYGQFLDSLETESLLGASSANGDLLQMEGLYSKARGASFSSCSGLKSKDHTLECEVLPSDTLLSLALKYNVQVAEIKRVNNIFTDGEVFALKKIKIPVRPAS